MKFLSDCIFVFLCKMFYVLVSLCPYWLRSILFYHMDGTYSFYIGANTTFLLECVCFYYLSIENNQNKLSPQESEFFVISHTATFFSVRYLLIQFNVCTLSLSVIRIKMTSCNFHDYLPILLCGLSIPLSMFMWLGNVAFTFFLTTNDHRNDGKTHEQTHRELINWLLMLCFRRSNNHTVTMVVQYLSASTAHVVRMEEERS